MKRIHSTAALIAAIFVLSLYSCSGKGDLLSSVPADNIQAVAIVDVDRILEEAGCTRDAAHRWEPTPALSRLSERNIAPNALGSLLTVSGSVDLSECAVWVTTDNNTWLLAKLTDESGLEKSLSEAGFTTTEEDGFTVYSSEGMNWFVKGGLIWGSSDRKASVRVLSAQIDNARNAPASKIAGVGDFIKAEGLGRVAIAEPFSNSGWIRAAVSTEGAKLTAAVSYVDSEGKVTAVKGLKKIDRSFLNFVPQDFPLTAAIGVGNDFDWSAIAKAAGLIFGFQAYGTIEAIMPILKSVEGTVAVAFLPGSDDVFDIAAGSMRFALFAQMKRSDAKSAMTKLRTYAGRFGLPVSAGPDDSFAVGFGDATYHAAYSSGYFIISNFRAEKLTRHATMAESGLASVAMTLSPSVLGTVIGLSEPDSSLRLSGTLSSEEAIVGLEFPGSEKPFVESLTTLLAD